MHLVYLRSSEKGRKLLQVLFGNVKINFPNSLSKSSIQYKMIRQLEHMTCKEAEKTGFVESRKDEWEAFVDVFIYLQVCCREDRASLFSLVHTKIHIFPFS